MMKSKGRTKSVGLTVIGAVAALTGGCELLPGLTASPGAEPAASSDLLVEVVDARGTVQGVPVDTSTIHASGTAHRTQVSLNLQLADRDTMVTVHIPSETNPYGDPSAEGPFTDAGFAATDGAVGRVGAGPEPALLACGSAHAECEVAVDLQLDDAQALSGRRLVLDGRWESGDALHLELHYASAE